MPKSGSLRLRYETARDTAMVCLSLGPAAMYVALAFGWAIMIAGALLTLVGAIAGFRAIRLKREVREDLDEIRGR